jgi:hypothetical protein
LGKYAPRPCEAEFLDAFFASSCNILMTASSVISFSAMAATPPRGKEYRREMKQKRVQSNQSLILMRLCIKASSPF